MKIPLPLCKWRRQPSGPGRHVCISPRIRCHGDGIPDELCSTCKHRDHEAPPRERLRCKHFGELLRVGPVRLLNRTDGVSILSRYHRCALHGECSPNTLNTALRCCQVCPDHLPDWRRERAGDIRHLTYHLYPSGPLWRWNVAQLVDRMSLFNGKRLVTVAWDATTAHPDEVGELFADQDVELTFVPNDPGGRELVSHVPMIDRLVDYRGDRDVTFYAHGKGASSYTYGNGVNRWAAAMYAALLDFWPAVRRELVDHGTVGIYRRVLSPAPARHVPWHYSGSFRWTRNQDLYQRTWQAIDPGWYGPETYPGRHFTTDESACLFGEFAYGGVGLYLEQTWVDWAQAAAEDWYADHDGDRRVPQLVSVILTAHAQRERVHEAIASVQAQTTDAWQCLVVSSGRISSAELMVRYRTDARVQLLEAGSRQYHTADRNGQAWAVNEAWRRNRVRGDLVVHLSDDDVLHPDALAGWLRVAALHPDQHAWYGMAGRSRIHADGVVELLGPLELRGVGQPGNPLRCHVDGLQVCHRRSVRTDWPEDAARAPEGDGWWMDALGAKAPLHPVDLVVGLHRHTPESTFTH